MLQANLKYILTFGLLYMPTFDLKNRTLNLNYSIQRNYVIMTVQAKTSRICTSDCVDDSIERSTKLKLSATLAIDFGKS